MPAGKPSPANRRRGIFRLAGWLLAGLLIAYMAYDLIFSDHGYLVYRREAHQLEALEREVAELRARKERLAKEILRLRNDPGALEELVHRELGYVYPDEYILIMPEEEKNIQRKEGGEE